MLVRAFSPAGSSARCVHLRRRPFLENLLRFHSCEFSPVPSCQMGLTQRTLPSLNRTLGEFASSTIHRSAIPETRVSIPLSRACCLPILCVAVNGIPIEGWTHDPSDEALLDLLPVLDSLRFTSDVRRVLGIRGFS